MNTPNPGARDHGRVVIASALPLARNAGVIAIVSGALFAAAQLVTFATMNRADLAGTLAGWPYRASAVTLLVGFAGLAIAAVALYERQAAAAGRLGAIGLCTALLGTFFLGGDYWFETFAVPWYAVVLPEILTIPGADWLAVGGTTSYLLFSLGWLLFAVAGLRADVFPDWPASPSCWARLSGSSPPCRPTAPSSGLPCCGSVSPCFARAPQQRRQEESTAPSPPAVRALTRLRPPTSC